MTTDVETIDRLADLRQQSRADLGSADLAGHNRKAGSGKAEKAIANRRRRRLGRQRAKQAGHR
jgi:hypothetical protein